MTHGRIVPTDQDGVENRFPGREDPTDEYNRNRCIICGLPWVHPEGVPYKEVVHPDGREFGVKYVPRDHDTISAEQVALGFEPCAGRPPNTFMKELLKAEAAIVTANEHKRD